MPAVIVRLLAAALSAAIVVGYISIDCNIARAEITIQDLIENVRRNEMIFDQLDVTLHMSHEIGANKPFNAPEMKQLVSASVRTKYVLQDGLFRLENAGRGQDTEKTVSKDRIRAFDGTMTRLYEKKAIGNIFDERVGDEGFVRPHMMMLRQLIQIPLSVYLSGQDAVRTHPLGKKRVADGVRIESTYHGECDYDNLKCHKVWITTLSKDGAPHDRWELWLAEDRNYLPVKLEGYTFHCSQTLPLGEGQVSDLREIEPGIWFPFAAEFTGYHPWLLQSKGVQSVDWRQRYIVEDVSLHPNYPADYFSNVEFPDGTTVYEIKRGEQVRSYRVGAPNHRSSARPGARILMLLGNVAVVLVVAVYALKKKRKHVA